MYFDYKVTAGILEITQLKRKMKVAVAPGKNAGLSKAGRDDGG